MAHDQFDDVPSDRESAGRARKKGWSTGAKVALVLGIFFGGVALICCGVMGYFAMQFQPITDPARIASVQDAIVSEIKLPEGFAANFAIDASAFGFPVKMILYSPTAGMSPSPTDLLTLMQIPGAADPEQVASELNKQGSGNQERVIAESTETKQITIDGRDTAVSFVKGKLDRSGVAVRQVSTAFPGKGGTAVFALTVPEEQWNEQAAIDCLQSIKK